MTAPTTPIEKIARVAELRRQADAIEAEAILQALEACNWRVQPASALLGIPYTSLIQVLKGRQKAIGAQLEKKREKLGGVRRPESAAK